MEVSFFPFIIFLLLSLAAIAFLIAAMFRIRKRQKHQENKVNIAINITDNSIQDS